jgi:translocation and assembly module TamA
VPITFQVSERKRHAVSLSAAYSTDLGGSAGATWTDRNAFGNAEQLAVTANLINAGGSATTQVGYQVGAQLTKPDFLRNDQSLQYSVGLLKQDLEAYDQDAVTAGIAVNRTLSSRWKASIGVTVEQEKIIQVLGVPNPPNPNDPNAPITYTATPFGNNYTLLGMPITLKYDSTGLSNPLDDPLHGVRVSGSITPTESFNSTANNGCALLVNRETASATASAGCPSGETRTPHATFLILQGSFATYLDLKQFGWTPEGRSVLAFRALGARAIGASQFAFATRSAILRRRQCHGAWLRLSVHRPTHPKYHHTGRWCRTGSRRRRVPTAPLQQFRRSRIRRRRCRHREERAVRGLVPRTEGR